MTPDEFRSIRKTLGLTQYEWGLWLGIGKARVSDLENGKRTVGNVPVTLARLADAFRCGYRLPPDG